MSLQVTGVLKLKKNAETISEKFTKREFVLTENSTQYPQQLSFQLTQDRCDLLNTIPIGAGITVHFNLRGREWISPQGEVKYFNTLEAWKIDSNGAAQPQTAAPERQTLSSNVEPDNLPF